MSRHTPGPWHLGSSDKPVTDAGVFSGATKELVALLALPNGKSGDLYHNARLIAAAPDMLNALHLAHTALTNTGLINPEAAARAVAAAIAKAEGQS